MNEFKKGMFGNDRTVIIIAEASEESTTDQIRDYISRSLTNPVMLVTQPSSDGIELSLPDESLILRDHILKKATRHGVRLEKSIIIGIRKSCVSSFMLAGEFSSKNLILFDPKSENRWDSEALNEIESRIIQNLLKNSRHSNLQVTTLIDSRNPMYETLRQIESDSPILSLLTYNWKYVLNASEFTRYFMPILANCIGSITYDQFPIVSRTFSSTSLTLPILQSADESSGNIELVEFRNQRVEIRGSAQINGCSAEKYGKQHSKVVLVGENGSYPFSVGPIKNEKKTFEFWEKDQTDYSVSSFGSFGGHGLDISHLPAGTYNLEVEIKNGTKTSHVVPVVKDNYKVQRTLDGGVITEIKSTNQGLTIKRNPISNIEINDFRHPEVEIVQCASSMGILVVIDDPVSSIKWDLNMDLILMGKTNYLLQVKTINDECRLEYYIQHFIPSDTYKIFFLRGYGDQAKLLDTGHSFSIDNDRMNVNYLRSSLSNQFGNYLANSPKAAIDLKLIEPSKNNSIVDEHILFDVLDIAILEYLDDSSTQDSELDELLTSFIRESDGVEFQTKRPAPVYLKRSLNEAVSASPRDFILVRLQLPKEADRVDGSRFFFNEEFIDKLNGIINALESDLLREYKEIGSVSPWRRGFRAMRQVTSRPSPLFFESIFFESMESRILQKLK
ncbi:hypothetical protein ACTXO0_16640 [Glutamicibacter ardleyensis]|uniref:hypothetical protein n=1 Tax=Glutamicibacter ardleyensis TaxID=225894 RepID=UPI003FD03B53